MKRYLQSPVTSSLGVILFAAALYLMLVKGEYEQGFIALTTGLGLLGAEDAKGKKAVILFLLVGGAAGCCSRPPAQSERRDSIVTMRPITLSIPAERVRLALRVETLRDTVYQQGRLGVQVQQRIDTLRIEAQCDTITRTVYANDTAITRTITVDRYLTRWYDYAARGVSLALILLALVYATSLLRR